MIDHCATIVIAEAIAEVTVVTGAGRVRAAVATATGEIVEAVLDPSVVRPKSLKQATAVVRRFPSRTSSTTSPSPSQPSFLSPNRHLPGADLVAKTL